MQREVDAERSAPVLNSLGRRSRSDDPRPKARRDAGIVLHLFLGSARLQKKRATLTVASIAWGTVTILLLLAFGEGLKRQFASNERAMGENLAIHWPGETSKGIWNTVKGQRISAKIFLGMEMFFGIIGALTLVIGCVGVANIMYAVVKERTREIGVKMALGARRGWITGPFLLEGLVYTLVGGLAGGVIAIVIVTLLGAIPPQELKVLEFLGKPPSPGRSVSRRSPSSGAQGFWPATSRPAARPRSIRPRR